MVFKLMTCVAVLSLALGLAGQPRAVGRVLSRNGVGLSGCQLDFVSSQMTYRAYTDQGGTFFIDNARSGQYAVTVLQGGKSVQISVTINGTTINPNPIVVPW